MLGTFNVGEKMQKAKLGKLIVSQKDLQYFVLHQ
jgi:hypothetical protein